MDANDDKLKNMMLEMEYIPNDYSEKIDTKQYTKFPLSELSALGIGFSNLFESTRTITQNINIDGLYRCTLPNCAA